MDLNPGWQLLLAIGASSSVWVFALCGVDKRAARRGGRRVPERSLLLPVLFGGLPGLLAGMLVFRHKTSKRSFQWKLAGFAALWLLSLLVMFQGLGTNGSG